MSTEACGASKGHTAYRSAPMARVYTRRADAFADNAGEGFLL